MMNPTMGQAQFPGQLPGSRPRAGDVRGKMLKCLPMDNAQASLDRVWDDDLDIPAPHYGVDDVPPPAETFFYAWQHTLVDVSPFVLPLVVAKAVGYDDLQAATMVSTCLALMGVFTFINATWGHRLPSVMGPSATLTGALASVGTVFGAPAMWLGAFCGGIFEALVGVSGVLGSLRRVLTPMVCGLVVTTIGLSLARVAVGWVFTDPRPQVLGLAGVTALLTVTFLMVGRRPGLGLLARGAIFFSLILAGGLGGAALGLLDTRVLDAAPWFALPQFGRFGLPGLGWELVAGAVLGALVGTVGSIAESVGDYAGTCAVSRVPYTMRHIRRGITVEGISSTVAPLFGAIPLTTYSQNTGVIATTRVASRRVIQNRRGFAHHLRPLSQARRAPGGNPARRRGRGLPRGLRPNHGCGHPTHRGRLQRRLRVLDHRPHPGTGPGGAARRPGQAVAQRAHTDPAPGPEQFRGHRHRAGHRPDPDGGAPEPGVLSHCQSR